MNTQSNGKEWLQDIANKLRNGEESPEWYVKEFREMFGYQRKGTYVDKDIRNLLDAENLTTEPDFSSSSPWTLIIFKDKEPRSNNKLIEYKGSSQKYNITRILGDSQPIISGSGEKINQPAASECCLKPDDTLSKAITLMLLKDLSAIPIIEQDRIVSVISLKSIMKKAVMFNSFDFSKKVIDFGEAPLVIKNDDSIIAIMPNLIRHECVVMEQKKKNEDMPDTFFIEKNDIITAFHDMNVHFSIISEIEHNIRLILSNTYVSSEITSFTKRKNGSSLEEITTFGDYSYILDDPNNWEKLNLSIDKGLFISSLKNVMVIRNNIMHGRQYSKEDAEEINILKIFNNMLKNIMEAKNIKFEHDHSR